MLRRLLPCLTVMVLLGSGCTRTVYVQVPAPAPAPVAAPQQAPPAVPTPTADQAAIQRHNDAVIRDLTARYEAQRQVDERAGKEAWRERWRAKWREEHSQPGIATTAPNSYRYQEPTYSSVTSQAPVTAETPPQVEPLSRPTYSTPNYSTPGGFPPVTSSAPLTPAYQPPVSSTPAVGEVYITRTGKKYHNGSCRHLSRSQIPISRENALAQGYTACSVCGG